MNEAQNAELQSLSDAPQHVKIQELLEDIPVLGRVPKGMKTTQDDNQRKKQMWRYGCDVFVNICLNHKKENFTASACLLIMLRSRNSWPTFGYWVDDRKNLTPPGMRTNERSQIWCHVCDVFANI